MHAKDLHISLISSLPEQQRNQILAGLTPNEAEALLYDWEFWARPKQLPPAGDWLTWLLYSGRGFGKTRTGAEWVINRAKNGPYAPIALIGQSVADVRDTMIEIGESSIIKISPPWFMPKYEPSKRRLTWPNGVIATTFSGDEPDQLRGPQHGTAWVDELAKFKYPQDTWDNLLFGLRIGDKPQICVTTTPRPIPLVVDLVKDPKTVAVKGTTKENSANLSPVFIDTVIRKYEGTRLGRQELDGDILTDVPGALWKLSQIETLRIRRLEPHQIKRIVVGVDPPGTTADCGIVVVAIGKDGKGYVLDDRSRDGTPAEWGRAVVDAFTHWQADCIVAETNQGGDMVAHTIRTIRDYNDHPIGKNLPIKQVRATRSKHTRAEPVSALYEQNRAHHVGAFAELEMQMTTWLPGDESPDRMDALVWAFTELFPLADEGETILFR